MSEHDRWLPLTSAQQGLYFAQASEPEASTWTTAEVVEITGELDVQVLAEAVRAAHDEHEQLRTRFRSRRSGPEQRVERERVHPWSVVDLRGTPDPERTAERWLATELARPMDLAAGDVVRSGVLLLHEHRTWWWHAAHHVVLDGYGAVQLLRRVAEHCAARLAGTSLSAAPRTGLADLVADDQRVQRGEDAAGAEQFWRARLTHASDVVGLAGRISGPVPRHHRASVQVPESVQHALTRGAKRLGVGWADLFQVAVGTYLARCGDADRIRIGLPVMNRTRPGDGTLPSAHTVCTAMNVLPATVLAGGSTLAQALAAFAAEQQALREHPFTPQERLARWVRRGAGGQLFGAQVNVLPFALDLSFGADVTGRVRNLTAGPVEDMTIGLRGVPGRRREVRLELDAHPELYSAAQVEAHLPRLLHWLGECAAADPDRPVADLSLLDSREREQVLHRFNDTAVPREAATLAQRFEAQRTRSPHAVALVEGHTELSCAQVGEASDRLARSLMSAGVRPGDVVGVLVPRSAELWIAVHAVQRIGAVHLPLDADQPVERVAAMLGEAGCDLVVMAAEENRCLLPAGVLGVHVHSAAPGISLPPVPDDPTAPAYLLFTSGSTGRPKGVLVQHAAIDNRLAWMQHQFPIGPGQRVLGKTPITFDVSVWEHFWPWQVGAAVVVAGPGVHRDPRALADLVVERRVDVLHFVPSMLRAFLADRLASARIRTCREAGEHRVRHVVCSGEALSAELVSECRQVFGVAPTNLYGPTEAAVDVTCQETEELTGTVVPIGRPVWNTRCYVLDRAGHPLPVGVPGRLWLGGVQVALGYLGRPDLTAERFVPDPFCEDTDGRMYDTGDLACWTAEGTLAYLGRSDDQVKVRGQRVELGEIEAVLGGVAGVTAVVAGLVASDLVVWFTRTEDVTASEATDRLRARARAVLPEGIRPSHWLEVSAVPLSVSGKADRATLLAGTPGLVRAPHGTDGVGPVDLAEQRICEIVAELLGLDSVAADADFFDLGGDSLKVLALLGELEDAFGTTLELRTVFAGPTPAELALAVGRDDDGRGDFAEVLTLRPGAAGVAPLVLLPPAGGLGWCYTSLLRHLPREVGVLTVQAPGLESGAPAPVADLSALARRQLAAVRSVVGDGAFHLAGWSLGGMAAHELAALARQQGQQVLSVVLLDAYPAEQWAHLQTPTEAEALVGILRLGGVEALATTLPPDVPLDRERTVELLRTGGSALAQLPDAVLRGALASVVEAARVVRTSTHHRLPGDVYVVVAGAPRPESWLDAAGWGAHTEGRVLSHRIGCGHGEMLRGEPAEQIGRLLGELLAGVPVG